MADLLSIRLFIRVASVAGLLVFALPLVSMDPFLSAAPVTGATQTVNRTLKGDRLLMFDSRVSPAGTPLQLQTQEKMPEGCDPAFSPVSSPSLANFYGRCTV
jgi:hypothetical protein